MRLGSRAFDILVTLIGHAGEIVSNAALMASVWPSTVVEPGALRVHLTGLRKVLGDGRAGQRYIVNVPLQGYCFVAPVTQEALDEPARGETPPNAEAAPKLAAAAPAPMPAVVVPSALPLPAQLTRLIGREDVVDELLAELSRRRCITLVGPAGMGKTSVALAAVRALCERTGQQAVFVGLAPLTAPAHVVASVISALGVPALADDPLRGLLEYLRERQLLIVLDNCEHLIQAAAELAEALLTGAPGVRLLVTSREPLRIQGEWVQRLASLRVPPSLAALSARDALGFPSIELFIERVRAGLDTFELRDADVPLAVEICRSLDGIPLALELAAAGVERLGLRGVAANLGNRLALLTRGRRTALPRHQTLRAALDWGYALLSPGEQALLQRLSIFKGRFTSESAREIARDLPGIDVDEDLFNLVSKSLVASDISGDIVQYWLLETTREYAASQLAACGASESTRRRHAHHMLQLADAAEAARSRQPPAAWLASHGHQIEDIRAALEWCLSPAGDARLAVHLAAASAPIWFAMSRIAEYLATLERALSALGDDSRLDPQRAMAMFESYGHALWHIRGIGPEAVTAFRRAFDIAERVGSKPDRLRVIWGLWLITNSSADYATTTRLAERFGEVAAGTDDVGHQLAYHRMMAMSRHFTGHHAQSRAHIQRLLEEPQKVNVSARNSGFQFDQRVAALTSLTRVLWVTGLPDQAIARGEEAIERAIEINHALSLCFALSVGCTAVALWCGDWERGERYARMLLDKSREYSLSFWHGFGKGYELALRRRRGEEVSTALLRDPPRSLLDILCTVDAGLADETGLVRGETGAVGWSAPELMRIRGERLLAAGDAAGAKAWFHKGLELARQQGALSWELRCTMSLARQMHADGATDAARAALSEVFERFEEGFLTRDLRDAAALLREWR